MADKIHRLECPKCGEAASGPDLASVQAAMKRHEAKKHSPKTGRNAKK